MINGMAQKGVLLLSHMVGILFFHLPKSRCIYFTTSVPYTCQLFLSQMCKISENLLMTSKILAILPNIQEDIPMNSEHFRRYLKLFSQLLKVLKTLLIDTKEQRNIASFFIYGIFRLTFLLSLDSNASTLIAGKLPRYQAHTFLTSSNMKL